VDTVKWLLFLGHMTFICYLLPLGDALPSFCFGVSKMRVPQVLGFNNWYWNLGNDGLVVGVTKSLSLKLDKEVKEER